MVRTLLSLLWPRLNPWGQGRETKIPQTVRYSQKINNKIHILIFKAYFLRVTFRLYSSEVNQ